MVKKIVWSKKALSDPRITYDYISKDSVHYAELTLQQIIHTTAKIKSSPLAGKIVPEFGDKTLREFIYKSFRIIYRIKNSTAYVVRIFHSSRSLARL